MKAVVTIIDDDGTIIIKDKVLMPQREGIETPALVKYARFVFEIRTVMRPELWQDRRRCGNCKYFCICSNSAGFTAAKASDDASECDKYTEEAADE